MVERKQQLEGSLQLHKYCRDVEDELQWIKERRSLAASNDYIMSLRKGAESAEEAPGNVCAQAIMHSINHCYDYLYFLHEYVITPLNSDTINPPLILQK